MKLHIQVPAKVSVGISTFLLAAILASAAHYRSIRDVDFKTFAYPWSNELDFGYLTWHWLNAGPLTLVRLVNGKHRFSTPEKSAVERERSPYLTFHFVTYGDLTGDGNEEAAVAVNYHTGGTLNWDYLYVYKLDAGKPKLLGRLQTGSRAYGGLIKAYIQNGLLTLDLADPERRTGDCCSDGFIRVPYRWDKGQFVEEGPREHGDLKPETH